MDIAPKSSAKSRETSPLVGVAPTPSGMLRLVSAADYTDRELAERIRSGDVKAFERVFRDYYGSLCTVVHGYVQSQDVAEELVQDLLLSVWSQRARLELRASLRVYLFSAARNRALNSIRRTRLEIARVRAAAGADACPRPLPGAQENLESRELATALGIAIAALPERRRLAFQLTQQARLSHAEAAAVMGIAPKTVAIHVGLARQGLRSRLRRFIDP